MGNWNQRWRPRRKYYYQDPPPSPPGPVSDGSLSYGVRENNVPSWEINFVSSMGIPWKKVVIAKRYMYCHDSIVQWNDSAGEEAFNNSKKRYWAEINGLPCDIPSPDPDIYIEDIDWNEHIDPEMILDLDREYFNPDETEDVERVKIASQKSNESLGWDVKNFHNCGDPWQCSHDEGNYIAKDTAQGWGDWDKSLALKNADNPWEASCDQSFDNLQVTTWGGDADKSYGWKQGKNHTWQSNNYTKSSENICTVSSQTVGALKAEGWNPRNSKTRVHESKHWNNSENTWLDHSVPGLPPKYRGWNQRNSQKTRDNESKDLDFRRTNSRQLDAGCRKREGPQQRTWRNKSSRFQESNQHRVSFA